ncbi:MAG: thiamine pyrophosphate-binding protein [Chloroflexi bacterium]|nr:thiamine pyrophosphate-binding protein [Chloroflexota bacterium]
MTELNGGQLAAKQLKLAGIDTAFGVVAGPMIEVMAGMQAEGIRVVNCRHEESACFAASAWGYITKKPGVVVAGSGPGMINTITGLHVATESGMPLVVLGGSAEGRSRGLGGFQEADQVAFARPGCKWTAQVDSTERIPELVYLALGKALGGRPGGVYLDFPGHLVRRRIDEERVQLRATAPAISLPHPDLAAAGRIAAMLAQAERPLVLVGKGAAWSDATGPLTRLVNLGIPYVASPMGRGVIADDNVMCMNAARSSALAGADAVLMVGGRFNWIFQFGRAPRFAAGVRLAQVDLIAEEMTSAADVEEGMVADCALGVEAIVAALEGRALASEKSGWVDALRTDAAKNEATIAEQMASNEQPINHYRLLRDIRDVLPRDVNVSVDAELTMGVARAVLPSYNPRALLNSGTTGCMGTGVPYAVGAKLAQPDRPAVAVVGDYAFGAAAMEVETAARIGANVVFVISNNGGIAGHSIQDRMFAPDSPPIAALLPVNYERMGEMVGGFSARVTDPAEIRPTLEKALAAKTVAVVNVLTDPKGGRRGSMYLA